MLYIRQANARGHVNIGWLDSYHSFSFGHYYNPQFMGFSDLRVINEDFIMPGMGFGMHPHKNMEILTYVLSGEITHKDSMGNIETLKAGEFQMMSAGTGVMHSEFNPSDTVLLHLLQIWIMPNKHDIVPRYEQKEFAPREGETLILSPTAELDSFKVYQNMKLWRYQVAQNQEKSIKLQNHRHYWLQMVKGNLMLNEQVIEQGDGVAISQEYILTFNVMIDSEFLLFDLS